MQGLDGGQDGRVVDHLADMLNVADLGLEVTGLEEGNRDIDRTIGDVRDLVVGVKNLEQTFEVPDLRIGQGEVMLLQGTQEALELLIQLLIGDKVREQVDMAVDLQA